MEHRLFFTKKPAYLDVFIDIYLRSELCKTKIGLNIIQMEVASVNLYRADSDWKYES